MDAAPSPTWTSTCAEAAERTCGGEQQGAVCNSVDIQLCGTAAGLAGIGTEAAGDSWVGRCEALRSQVGALHTGAACNMVCKLYRLPHQPCPKASVTKSIFPHLDGPIAGIQAWRAVPEQTRLLAQSGGDVGPPPGCLEPRLLQQGLVGHRGHLGETA